MMDGSMTSVRKSWLMMIVCRSSMGKSRLVMHGSMSGGVQCIRFVLNVTSSDMCRDFVRDKMTKGSRLHDLT